VNPALAKLLRGIQGALPAELANDVKNNLEAVVRSNFEKLDLATREQLEIQGKILERTRNRVTELERNLKNIEELVTRLQEKEK